MTVTGSSPIVRNPDTDGGSGDAHGLSLSTNPTRTFTVAGTGDTIFILPFNIAVETDGDNIRSTTTLASGNLGAGSVPIGAAGVVPPDLDGIWEISGQCSTTVGDYDAGRRQLHIALCLNTESLFTAAHRGYDGVLDGTEPDATGNHLLTASITPYWIYLVEGDYIYMAVASISGSDLTEHVMNWPKLTMKFVQAGFDPNT